MKEEDRAYHAAMYKQNGHKEAINHLTILLESSPWSVQYLEARAECYEHRGMYDDAILDLRVPSSADFDFKIYGSLAKHT